jgi:hypothetical protein
MEFFKNFCKDDDKLIGLCSFKKKKFTAQKNGYEPHFGATKLVYEPKMRANMFLY